MSEVLITLGIIGVVAALTMPVLIQNHTEKKTVTQLNKAYSTLSQAWLMVQTEFGPLDTWDLTPTRSVDSDTGEAVFDFTAQSIVAKRLQKYLNIAKICEDGKPCFNEQIFDEANSDHPAESNFYLQDGTFIALGYYSGTGKASGDIMVTIPGAKDRINGKTSFFFNYDKKGIIPEGSPQSSNHNQAFTNCGVNGRGCTAWVIINKNMDYLHCPDKLGWDKASKCK